MKIQFHGAAGTVTGSCYEITPQNSRSILVDFGMFQGPEEIHKLNREPLRFNPSDLGGVILTHAHLDHCGRLPLLTKHGFSGSVYMTAATRDLVELVLYDSAKIAAYDTSVAPLYERDDVTQLLARIKTIAYHQPLKLGDLTMTLYDAGHIMGSASVLVQHQNMTIAFSGDLGNSPQDIEKPTEFIQRADTVVMEATYGDRLHPAGDARQLLRTEINAIEANHSTLLIPAFSLERTQVLLHMIDHLKKSSSIEQDTAVFLDSPMGIGATDIYQRYRSLYNRHLAQHSSNDDPFDFPGLVCTDSSRKSKKIKKHGGAKVIIAGSGMMTGGRVVSHAVKVLPEAKNRLLIVGYQAVGTLGRQILAGASTVNIYGKPVPVRATVSEITTMSAHADQTQLLAWLAAVQGVKQVFLVHADDESREGLADTIRQKLDITNISLPRLHEASKPDS